MDRFNVAADGYASLAKISNLLGEFGSSTRSQNSFQLSFDYIGAFFQKVQPCEAPSRTTRILWLDSDDVLK
jgi:hypothetical protein